MNDELRAWLNAVNLHGTLPLDWLRAGPWLDELDARDRELQQLRDERDERDVPGAT
ncbi:hypothetical protein AB3X94_00945 [Paraburkholderia sp. BR10923]|uniref:hypothetical protein n=1 Tax=Paraburkholderia sp. BR10923 TaxID=3236992 RepID=UPI0034CED88A